MPTEPRYALEPIRTEHAQSLSPWAMWIATLLMGIAFALGTLF